MTEHTRIVWLIVVMMAAVTVSTAVAITVLYRTAFEQVRAHLIQTAEDQAHLIDAVARFDQLHQGGSAGGSGAATLSQIQTAFHHYPSKGQIGEIAVAQRQGDKIVYLVTHGQVATEGVEPIPFDSIFAEPMRQALSGRSGTMIGLDYRAVTVLAAYQPIPHLHAGVVAKVDIADIRAPFVRGAAMIIGLATMLVTAGTVLFVRLTNPIVRHLNETEQRYQRIFQGAPVPIWEQDISGVSGALQDLRSAGVMQLGGHLSRHPELLRQLVGKVRIKEANAAALDLFGASSGRQFIAWFERTFVPATLDLYADTLQALWDGGEALLNQTVTVKALDGRDLTVNLSMTIPGANSEYRSVPAAALDVSADVSLRRREAELALILASTGEGIFGLDIKGRCTFVNRAALRMLGYRDEEELLGQAMHPLIHHSCRDGTPLAPENCPILPARSQDKSVCLEDELLWRRDGTSFPAEYRSYPMRREGATLGTVVTFSDITQRKEREAQLVQAQKLEVIGQLTGSIAHAFNNLLTIILTNLHVLKGELGEVVDADIAEVFEDAESAAQDGASLTRRLLTFASRHPLEPHRLDLDAFIQHTSRFLRRITGSDIELIVKTSGGPLPVRVDRQQLESALLNLTINARDAMPGGGTLTIEARRQSVGIEEVSSHPGLSPGDYVVVSVSDTGVGMSPEVVQRAVEPFYTTKPVGKGSGLGLSSALVFAQQSGGDLRITSAPGKGTTVSIFLPEAAPGARHPHRKDMAHNAYQDSETMPGE
jgi:PAS domain S-box-containing protein